jgi:methylmalonyl-CoA/ethylmalonyl-CoA epimerase
MGLTALSWAPPGTFHHVGFVIAAIRDVAQGFAQSIDSEWDGDIVYDPHQQVRVTFLRSKAQGDPLIELIEPVGDKSPVLSFLKRGGGLHHLCYLVDSLEKQLETCSSRGMVVLRPPLPAVAFGNRRIAWVCTNNNLLIEYLER